MPFKEPFVKNFRKGDLFYGISDGRNLYLKALPTSRSHPHKIDDFSGPHYERIYLKFSGEMPVLQNDFSDFLRRHPKYKVIFDRPSPGNHDEVAKDNMRKCKAGLSWAAVRGITIHFVLDGLNVESVPYKAVFCDVDTHVIHASVTNSELRWVYRNRHDPAVAQCIQFWRDQRPVQPPWTGEGAALWANYQPTRTIPPPLPPRPNR